MIDIILKNPYRILGVYSTSSKKEMVANQGKMKAFLKVGKSVNLQLDFKEILGNIERTLESVVDSDFKLTLANEQVKYAQFWFCKATPFDDIAFNHLLEGNIDNAISIWKKKENVSSLQNLIVCTFIKDDISSVILYAERLYTNYANEFVKMVLGNESTLTEDNLATDFLDSLCNYIKPQSFFQYISNDKWKTYVVAKITKPLIHNIQSAIETSEKSKGQGATARYNAGIKLMNETKSTLTQLNKFLNKTDLQYQMIADKLSQEILQCGIDYFNNSDDDAAPKKGLVLQLYAQSIAVGKMMIDRCKDNVDTLKNIGDDYIVRKELEMIASSIKHLRGDNVVIGLNFGIELSEIKRQLDVAIRTLQTINQKIGSSNKLYIQISSALASAAINAIVEKVNNLQKVNNIHLVSFGSNDENFKNGVQSAVELMAQIGQLTMESKTRNYYNGNNSTLNSINSKLNPSGCYIATMAYGDYDHPQVMILREFRDNYLSKRRWGKKFIRIYYKYSPRLVERLKDKPMINKTIRKILDSFIEHLKN